MAIKVLWYLSSPDGPYPWEPEGRWITSFRHLQQLAATIDQRGYYGALVATGLSDEVLTVSAAMIGVTKTMRFLPAIHPGLLSPIKLAQAALTQDRFSGGRLLFNVVNGNDVLLPAFGVHYEHDERYDFSYEYWDAFQRFYVGQRDGYDGKYIKLAPTPKGYGLGRRGVREPALQTVQAGGVPLWGAGASSAGVAHSIKLLDTYLSFADTPPKLGARFRQVAEQAAGIGRSLNYGTRLQVIVRETEEEAWDYAQWLIDRTHIDFARQTIEMQLPRGETIDSYRSPDPQVQANLDLVRAGKLPRAKDLEIYPNVWVGPSLFGFNILSPLAGTALVGSAENVAARLREYEAQGVTSFILSGFPLIEEAERFADLVFPLLDLDHGFEIPRLGRAKYPQAAE